ncbi:MAG: hypothetical protein IPK82_23250, partial [Polyangiaceae bacterium]|nr:hypothetical protein [Polyangiaceae bacterium]
MAEPDLDETFDWEKARRMFPRPPAEAIAGLERYLGRVLHPATRPRGRLKTFVISVWDVDTEQGGTAALSTHDATF